MQVSAFIIYLLFHWWCTEGYPINPDGSELIENDIVGPHIPSVIGNASRSVIGAALVGSSKWLDKTVPYEFSYQFDVATQNKVFNAMKEIQDKTCIHFRRKKNIDRNYVHFMQDANNNCYSHMGMKGGSQDVSLPHWCVNNHDSVLHELLHALGIVHEQNRHDRDDYITIHWDNLGVSREDINWKKYSQEQLLYYQTEYDFHSVMHYPARIVVKQGPVTAITPIYPGVTIKSNGLSKNDIRRINKHYGCSTTDGNDNNSNNDRNNNNNRNRNNDGLHCDHSDTYEVAYGDYCWKIWTENGMTEDEFFRLNPRINCNSLLPGQRICLSPNDGVHHHHHHNNHQVGNHHHGRVSFYDYINYQGYKHESMLTHTCTNFPDWFNGKTTSINTSNQCVRLFARADCHGSTVQIKPGGKCIYSNLRQCNFNNLARSFKGCEE